MSRRYDRARAANRWLQADGKAVPIHKMSSAHIAACIKMIKEMPGWRDEMLPLLEAEYSKRVYKGGSLVD